MRIYNTVTLTELTFTDIFTDEKHVIPAGAGVTAMNATEGEPGDAGYWHLNLLRADSNTLDCHCTAADIRLTAIIGTVNEGESSSEQEAKYPVPLIVQTWNHARKGPITGTIVHTSDDGEWVDIELATDHQLRYIADSNRGMTDEKGEVIRVRKSFLTEVA